MTNNLAIGSSADNSYDELPYESYPYAQSHPEHLRSIGMLFGLTAPDLANARILELGCAAGGNLIPIAVNYPNSKCVGVDLSKVQIDSANETIKELKLNNIEMKNMSITDINKSHGKFDYIICHGVISWVPSAVRSKIMDVCSNNLSPDGIAYISYNTLPGWNMVRSIRDMMLYHIADFDDVQEKIIQARSLLHFINESTEHQKSPYSEFLRNELQILSNQPDHYLRHDHLEETNHQYYFNEFMSEASKRGLAYLGDSSIASMYLGNLPEKVSKKLSEIQDIVKTEQYMDYIQNRRFRSTLLCHKDKVINRNLSHNDAMKFYLSMKVSPEKPIEEVDITNENEKLNFYFNKEANSFISTENINVKALLYTFAKNQHIPKNADEIAKDAVKLFPGKVDAASIKKTVGAHSIKMMLNGLITFTSEAPLYTDKVTDESAVSKYTLYQANKPNNFWITNYKHERLNINHMEKYALRYLDGKHTKQQVTDKVLEHINNGDINVSRNGQAMTDTNEIKASLLPIIDSFYDKVSKCAIISR